MMQSEPKNLDELKRTTMAYALAYQWPFHHSVAPLKFIKALHTLVVE
jgi:hypothetical protein